MDSEFKGLAKFRAILKQKQNDLQAQEGINLKRPSPLGLNQLIGQSFRCISEVNLPTELRRNSCYSTKPAGILHRLETPPIPSAEPGSQEASLRRPR